MGTKLVGDCLSRGTNQLGTHCEEPNVRGPYAFGTKCVTAIHPYGVIIGKMEQFPLSFTASGTNGIADIYGGGLETRSFQAKQPILHRMSLVRLLDLLPPVMRTETGSY